MYAPDQLIRALNSRLATSYAGSVKTDRREAARKPSAVLLARMFMRSFADRLVGKSIKSIEIGEPGYGIAISLSDGAGFTVHSEITTCLSDIDARAIERVEISNEQVILHLSGNGFVAISKDRERFPFVELFVYGDDEGMVVEN